MRLRAHLLAVALAVAVSARAEAGLTITLGDATITAGSSTQIEIQAKISGTSEIGDFTAAFSISVDHGYIPPTPSAYPSFVASSSDQTFNDSNYVFNNGNSSFAGGSFGSASDPNQVGFNTEFVGADYYGGTDSSGQVAIGSNNVLADLFVVAKVPQTTNPAGDHYLISLDLARSEFDDGSGSPISSSDITQTSGTILVLPPGPVSAVPEPSTLLLGISGAVFLAGWRFFSTRRNGRIQRRSPLDH